MPEGYRLLPLDNIFLLYLLECWPVILAVIITVMLIYQFLRPKISADKLLKGQIRQGILSVIEAQGKPQDEADTQEWFVLSQRVANIQKSEQLKEEPPIHYCHYINLSLCWTLFWSAAFFFILIRIILNPYYYGVEAVFLGYFAYYILIGLISYFKR